MTKPKTKSPKTKATMPKTKPSDGDTFQAALRAELQRRGQDPDAIMQAVGAEMARRSLPAAADPPPPVIGAVPDGETMFVRVVPYNPREGCLAKVWGTRDIAHNFIAGEWVEVAADVAEMLRRKLQPGKAGRDPAKPLFEVLTRKQFEVWAAGEAERRRQALALATFARMVCDSGVSLPAITSDLLNPPRVGR